MPYLVDVDDGTTIPISTSRATRIGRGPGNDLILSRPSVSRRHATISAVADGGGLRWVVTNHSATNPVLVTGDPIEGSRALKDGDILRIGDLSLTFTSTTREVTDDETVEVVPGPFVDDGRTAGQDLIGSARDVLGVLAMLANAQRTGRILFHAIDGDSDVAVWLARGDIIAARAALGPDLAALVRLVRQQFDEFWFFDGEQRERSITIPTMGLLMELARRRDQQARVASGLTGPADLVPTAKVRSRTAERARTTAASG
ncbi:MAG: FHA domain-containing protein [Planctomycetes bacterium]|nr:FHA domain-containing protein [Planctomycetota bacterium]